MSAPLWIFRGFLIISALFTVIHSQQQCGLFTGSRFRDPHGSAVELASEVPWQVTFKTKNGRLCGGALIGRNWFITTAHCVDFLRDDYVDDPSSDETIFPAAILGRLDRMNVNDGIRIEVENYFVHPNYNRLSLDYDFAIGHFKAIPEFNDSALPICLLDDCTFERGALSTCSISGWGSLEGGMNRLHRAITNIWNRQECNAELGQVYGEQMWLTDRMTCAHMDNGLTMRPFGNCLVDDGGPLACLTSKTGPVYLHGIASFRTSDCNDTYPGTVVYARPCSVNFWITDVMKTVDNVFQPAGTAVRATDNSKEIVTRSTTRLILVEATDPATKTTKATSAALTTRPKTTPTTTTTTTVIVTPTITRTITTKPTTTTTDMWWLLWQPAATTTAATTTTRRTTTTTSAAQQAVTIADQSEVDVVRHRQAAGDSFPWYGRIIALSDGTLEAGQVGTCGSALINNNWLLTTASCINRLPSRNLIVKLNASDTLLNDGVLKPSIARIEIHPQYSEDNYDYDFALLKLQTPVGADTSPQLRSVSLLNNCGPLADGASCLAAVWNLIEPDEPRHRVLQASKMVLLESARDCRAAFYSPSKYTPRKFCGVSLNNASQTSPVNECQIGYASPVTCVTPETMRRRSRVALFGLASSFPRGCGNNDGSYVIAFSTPCIVNDWITSVVTTT